MPLTLTPELKAALADAGGAPLRLEDPETKQAYLLVEEDAYRERHQTRPAQQASQGEPGALLSAEVPEGIREAQRAFFRDLPTLLGDRRSRGKWVVYHRGRRLALGRRERDVLEEVLRRGIPSDEFCTFVVEPRSQEPEEVDDPSAWR